MAKKPTEPLKITARLFDGRVNSTDGLLFLDAILYHAWFMIHAPGVLEGTVRNDHQKYIGLPLRQEPGNRWAASIGQYTLYEETVEHWVKRPDFSKSFADRYLEDGVRKVNTKSGHLKAYRTPQIIRVISDVVFYAVGNPDKIQEMLSRIDHIGKKGSAGWGMVSEWIVEPCEEDYSLVKDGRLMRPIPVEEADRNDFDRSLTVKRLCAIKPPYWKAKNATLCYVPKVGIG